MRRALLAISLVGASLLVAPVAPASAVTYCPSGTYVQRSYSYDGSVVAALCFGDLGSPATLQSQGHYRGVPKYMSLQVCRLIGNVKSNCVTDAGTFSYYAGPVDWAAGCAYFRSIMYNGSGLKIVDREWYLCN